MTKTQGALLGAASLIGVSFIAGSVSQSAPTIPVETSTETRTVPASTPEPKKVAPQKAPTQSCNPNYSGCLKPDASDYDCAGGSGNGPYYTGKVQVLGYDEYGLDRDGDGWACDK